MRIGLVLPSASVYSETFFSNKIRGLQAHGFTVILFVNEDKGISSDSSLKIKAAPKLSGSLFKVTIVAIGSLIHLLLFHFNIIKRLYLLDKTDGIPFAARIKHLIANHHILTEPLDWLHFGFGTMALQRENVAAAIGAKMAVSFRGFDIAIYPVKHPDCYERLWRKLDKIHVISNDIKALLYNHGFKDQAEVVKITPAIDVSFFKWEKEVNLDEPIHLVTIARLHWKKGLDYTLESLSLLKQAGVNFKYTIIGEGPEYERLKFTIYQLGMIDHVTFIGKISHDMVKGQLEKASIYIQYSIQEGFCNAVLEAQAMGLLCVVSDAEGLTENVLHGITGFVVPKRQPKQLAKQLLDLIAMDKKQYRAVCDQAQMRVQSDFNLETQQLAFKSFYTNGKQ